MSTARPAEAVSEHLSALERLVPGLARDARRAVLGDLARVEALLRLDLLAEATGRPAATSEDRLLGAPEASGRLGVTPEYVYRHANQFPFTVRLGRAVRFSSAGIDLFIRTRQGR